MTTISASVGVGGVNKRTDIALIQVMLKNQATGRAYYPYNVDGLGGEELKAHIFDFQSDVGLLNTKSGLQEKGIVKPNSLTFQKLKTLSKFKHSNLRAFSYNHEETIIVDTNQRHQRQNTPTLHDLPVPTDLYQQLIKEIQLWSVDVKVVNIEINSTGQFKVTLSPKAKFYEKYNNKFVNGFSLQFSSQVARNYRRILKNWPFVETKGGKITFKSDKQYFFRPPLKLLPADKFLFTKTNSLPNSFVNLYEKQFVAALIRPLRKRQSRTEQTDREFNLSKISQFEVKQMFSSLTALDALFPQKKYHELFSKAYAERLKQQKNNKRKATALILISVSIELYFIVGAQLKIGLLLDPNTNKEYIYFNFEVGAGGRIGGGVSGEIEVLKQRIDSLRDIGDIRSGFEKSISLGPFYLAFTFGSGKTKFPDFEWFGIPDEVYGASFDVDDKSLEVLQNMNIEDLPEDLKSKVGRAKASFSEERNVLDLQVDSETGKFLKQGEKSTAAKRRGQNKINKQLGTLPIAKVDFGPVQLECSIKPEASGKIKIAFAPEISYNYTNIFEADIDGGEAEKQYYALARAFLPEVAVS